MKALALLGVIQGLFGIVGYIFSIAIFQHFWNAELVGFWMSIAALTVMPRAFDVFGSNILVSLYSKDDISIGRKNEIHIISIIFSAIF